MWHNYKRYKSESEFIVLYPNLIPHNFGKIDKTGCWAIAAAISGHWSEGWCRSLGWCRLQQINHRHCCGWLKRHNHVKIIKKSVFLFWLLYKVKKGPYPGKHHVFVLALLYLFECLNEWRQHSDRLQLLETSVGNVIRFRKDELWQNVGHYIFVC